MLLAPLVPVMLPQAHTATLDYRYSHIRDGADYEAELERHPLDVYLSIYEAERLTAIVTRLFPSGVNRYLDFACGTGRITRVMEPLVRMSFAVDVSPGMMKLARARCTRTTFLLRDVTHQPVPIDAVDVITAFRFFGNAQDELRVSALHALRGLLRDDGYLILNNHRNPWSLRNLGLRVVDRKLPDYHGRSTDLHYWKLRRLLATAGFRIVHTCGVGLWIFRAALERREVLQSRMARLFEPMSRLPFAAPFCPDAIIVAQPARRSMRGAASGRQGAGSEPPRPGTDAPHAARTRLDPAIPEQA